jgi:small subunit ribosomal protein S20
LANIKSAIKRARQNVKQRVHNMSLRSRMRTFIKDVRKAIETKDKTAAEAKFRAAVSVIDKTAQKKIIKRETAARYKSRLSASIKQMA